MKLLWNFRATRDRELASAAWFTQAMRFFGVNCRKTFIGVVVVETTPGLVVIASDAAHVQPRKRPAHPARPDLRGGSTDRTGLVEDSTRG